LSVFFFSSRRRHTRFSRDWSSDVCSSDLTKDVPYVPDIERIRVEKMDNRFFRIFVYYGFKDQPNIPVALKAAYKQLNFEFDMMRSEERRVGKECRVRWGP